MSDHHDDHGGGGPANKNSLFFMIGAILIMAVIGIGNIPAGTPPTRPPRTPVSPTAMTLPPSEQIQPPTILENILISPNPIPDRVKKEPQVASIAPWGYTLSFASKFKPLEKLLEGTSFQKVHTIKTVNAGEDGREVEEAAIRMTPLEIQENNMKLITYDQHLTANHVQCYYDEDGGNRHVPDENIFAPVAIGWNKFRGGTIINHAVMSTGTLTLEGYNLFNTQPDEAVTPQNGLDCYTQSDFTDHVGLYDMGDTDEIYKGSDHNLWSPNKFCSAGELSKYDECMAQPCKINPKTNICEKPSCDLTCGEDAHTVYSTHLPDADNVNKYSGKGPNDEKEGFTLTQIDAAFDFPNKNGTNDQPHTLQIPLCPGCNILSETAIYYLEARRRIYMKAFNCSLTPTELQDPNNPCPTPLPEPTPTDTEVCQSKYFDQFKEGIKFSAQGKPANAGYTIPYRGGGTLTEAMKKEAIRLMGPQMMNGGSKGIANINKYWDMIGPTAKKYGWNPVFVVTLWIEESAAGGHPNASHDLGCLYGWSKANGQGAVSMPKVGQSNVCDQMACLFSHPVKNPSDFSGFMCSYNSDTASQTQFQCQASSGWTFPKNVKLIYDLLTNAK